MQYFLKHQNTFSEIYKPKVQEATVEAEVTEEIELAAVEPEPEALEAIAPEIVERFDEVVSVR